MPELPEVETIVRRFHPLVAGRTIVRFTSFWPRQLVPGPKQVSRALQGRTITVLRRRAKYIVADLDDGERLLIHLRMSGRLEQAREGAPMPPHTRAAWDFADGARLLFVDARKFGRIVVGAQARAFLAALGPEPLEPGFTPAALARLLRGSRRRIKPLLLDQARVAGLGNIYTDEALFRAGVHPMTPAGEISPEALRKLTRAIRAVLREGIRRQGTTIDWIYPEGRMQDYLNVYGRAGETCRRCGDVIERLLVGQRGTWRCPTCQPDGRRRASAMSSA